MNTDGHRKEHNAQGGGTGLRASAGKGQALGVLPASTDAIPLPFLHLAPKGNGSGGAFNHPSPAVLPNTQQHPKTQGAGGGTQLPPPCSRNDPPTSSRQ